jgi:hypothetical protein
MVKWIQGCFISSKMVYELKRGAFAREKLKRHNAVVLLNSNPKLTKGKSS